MFEYTVKQPTIKKKTFDTFIFKNTPLINNEKVNFDEFEDIVLLLGTEDNELLCKVPLEISDDGSVIGTVNEEYLLEGVYKYVFQIRMKSKTEDKRLFFPYKEYGEVIVYKNLEEEG